MPQDSIARTRLLLLGGGHSQVEVLRQLACKPRPEIEITLVSRSADSLYSGMLPGLVAGHYRRDQCHIHLPPLAKAAGAKFLQAEVTAIDADNHCVHCADDETLEYDFLSINTGSVPATAGAVLSDSSNLQVKPVAAFVDQWFALERSLRTADRPMDLAVIGGGPGGVELLMAMQYANASARVPDKRIRCHRFHLFTDTAHILPAHHPGVQKRVERILAQRGVHLHTGQRVTRVMEGTLECADHRHYEMDHVLWVTQAAAPAWIRQSNLATDAAGFIRVNNSLQSVSHAGVFAAGDIAATDMSLQKSGVVAVRQGPVLARNLLHAIRREALCVYRPQQKFLALISCGEKYAVASRGNLHAEGRWLWYLKDQIDRRFIQKYNL